MKGWLVLAAVASAGAAWGTEPAASPETGPAPDSERPHEAVISKPHWVRLPSADQLAKYWPAGNLTAGTATMTCVVKANGELSYCKVIDETPKGSGFGAAALKMAGIFKMLPQVKDGRPVAGGLVTIPFHFNLASLTPPPPAAPSKP